MKIFLDITSLFKLYHQELETVTLEKIFSTSRITINYLSEITKTAFTSTIW